jgi:hypothetical protein
MKGKPARAMGERFSSRVGVASAEGENEEDVAEGNNTPPPMSYIRCTTRDVMPKKASVCYLVPTSR